MIEGSTPLILPEEARLPEDGFTRLCPRELVCRRSQSERLH